jgi:hypothetical protein
MIWDGPNADIASAELRVPAEFSFREKRLKIILSFLIGHGW